MRYKYKQSLFTILLFGAICLVDAATIIKVIVDWVNGKTFNVAVNIITLVLCVLVVVPIVMTLTTRYKISAEHLNMYLGIINLTKNKIQTSNIVYVVRRKNQLFVAYVDKNYSSELVTMQIVILQKEFDSFANQLKKVNSNIAYIEED